MGEAEEKSPFLDPRIDAGERRAAPAGIRRLHARVELGRLDAVSGQELLPARQALRGGREPEEEAVLRLQRRPCLARNRPLVGAGDAHRNRRVARRRPRALPNRRNARRIRPRSKPPDTPGDKEVKVQEASVRATRKPATMYRSPATSLRRAAARRSLGSLFQDPPRMTRTEHMPLSQARPPPGAPA